MNICASTKPCAECKFIAQKGISFCSLHLKKEEKKMKGKRVVFEKPEESGIVTYKKLKELGACVDAIDWFVETFGNKAKYEDVFISAGGKNYDGDWRGWLENHKKYFCYSKEDVVYVDNISNNKIYAFYSHGTIYKFHVDSGNEYTFISLDDSKSFAHGHYKTFIGCFECVNNNNKIYQFDNQKDFIDWCYEVTR